MYITFKTALNEQLSEHHLGEGEDKNRVAGRPGRGEVLHYRQVRQGSVRLDIQCNHGLTQPTVGIDFLVKNVTYNAKSYRLQLWDTAGQERFRALIPNYLKDAKCALIIIDISNRRSLENA